MTVVRYTLWGLVAVAALALAALYLTRGPLQTDRGGSATVEIGGPFTLTAGDGRTVTEGDFDGRPHMVYFGFTYCPDVCPTTLSEVGTLLDEAGAPDVPVLFVTVDPERDGLPEVEAYAAAFGPNFVGLTGSLEQIDAMATAYRVYYRKVPLDDGDYTVDHSASVFMMDAEGRFAGTIRHGEARDAALAKIQRLVGAEASGPAGSAL